MTGALAALASVGGVGGGGGGGGYTGSPAAVTWANISGVNDGSNGVQTMSGIIGSVPVTVSSTGSGTLLYTLNGVTSPYTGGFNWPNGQTLSWSIQNNTVLTVSGTITVTNAQAASTMATFTYSVKYFGG